MVEYLHNGTINARQKKKTILNSLNDRVVYKLCNNIKQKVDLLEYALNKELFVHFLKSTNMPLSYLDLQETLLQVFL